MIDKLPKLRMSHLDRNSFKPIYFQLAELIQNQIEDGDLEPGKQIPSERELMEQFDISRNTVRMAIESLLKDGLVYRVPTKGTFVAPGKMQFGLFNLRSFSEEMLLLGMNPSSRILILIWFHLPLAFAKCCAWIPPNVLFVSNVYN